MNGVQKGLAFAAGNHRQFWKQDLHLRNYNLLFEYVLLKHEEYSSYKNIWFFMGCIYF